MNPLEVRVVDENGKEISLGDAVLGKWTVLYVYPKDNTPGCTTEAKEFTELLPEFEKLGFQVIGVSKDSVKSHIKFKERHGLRIRLLSDPGAELIKALGAWGKKKRYGKEYEGVIRSTFIFNPNGEIVWKKINVRARGHAAKVLEEAKRLAEES
ncbi:peroxiredoxin [Thermococcus thioreducens]|uniref:thioredoxin-dependent peroxiredoxin n=1 Tax=Thermococcus thioreducens TaxID=277988 RepID=A0A0Q2XMF1_9EURY|nr:peroxiredoxin [Thermococcus thioreducens]ASJ12591.1 peroxiredoxin [Thermococcus thioreducens]KQH82412.1 peroxiredoxin, bacterioferritin comigratory like protein, AhpC/TSA family [Thermococcus thioreducens]SEV88211.1 peroxiredoxin Q/BCP [Thermococcus thioreducens]